MSDGPFQEAFGTDTTGVVRREIVTYRYKDGIMIKETAARVYTGSDYNDSSSSIPLVEIK
jgi:hypothetical protein